MIYMNINSMIQLKTVKKSIKEIIEDVYKRKNLKIALQLKDILVEYADRIGREKFDIGRIEGIEYEVPLVEGAKPVSSKPYNHPPHIEEEINKTVAILEQCGLIEKYHGEWASPVLVVINNDGSTRMCIDYTKVNRYKTDDLRPIIDDSIAEFHGKYIQNLI